MFLTAVAMKSSVFWNIMSCNLSEVNPFRMKMLPPLSESKSKPESNEHEADSKQKKHYIPANLICRIRIADIYVSLP
jgi:hypothetical protein